MITSNMKKIICLMLAFLSLLFTFGCAKRMVINNTYELELLEDGTVALGDIYSAPSNGVLFVPNVIDGYTVAQLGYNFGRFKGNYQYEGRNTNVTRFYSPNSIKRVDKSYMLLVNYLKIFYCGEVTDLSGLALSILSDESGIYVPADLYDDFIEATEEFARCQIKKANVAYMLDENTYYYVDFYENGSKILYLPPLPQKQGYTFEGWYTEPTFENKWNFETDSIQDDKKETKLYSYWIES